MILHRCSRCSYVSCTPLQVLCAPCAAGIVTVRVVVRDPYAPQLAPLAEAAPPRARAKRLHTARLVREEGQG